MKATNYFRAFGIMALLICGACNKDLDLSPESSYNVNDFYKTESDFRQALFGTYAGLRGINGYQYSLMMESLSDNVSTATNNPYTRLSFSDGETDVLAIWSAYWSIINRSNNILSQIDQGTFSSELVQNIMRGEARFLRAYSYFQLGWLFGGVPIIDHPMTADEITSIARSSQEETLAFAAAEFLQAADVLQDEQGGDNIGRATSYAAKGLLARLYLFTKNYEAAKPLLEEIIASNQYQSYETYADCFLNSKDNGSEHIFQVQYTSGLTNQGNELVYSLVPENIRSALFPNGGRSLWLQVSKDLYESYEPGDIRRDFTIQKGYSTSSDVTDTSTLLYIKLAHGTVPANAYDNDVNISLLRYTDVKLMYAEVLNELSYGADGEAFNLVNEVRVRAGLHSLEAADAPSKEAFREALFKERRVEFACESLRWFDIVRQGADQAQHIMDTFLARPEEGNSLYTFDKKFTLLPIPATERQTNPGLEQNPGY